LLVAMTLVCIGIVVKQKRRAAARTKKASQRS
jgi:hypothetical protein